MVVVVVVVGRAAMRRDERDADADNEDEDDDDDDEDEDAEETEGEMRGASAGDEAERHEAIDAVEELSETAGECAEEKEPLPSSARGDSVASHNSFHSLSLNSKSMSHKVAAAGALGGAIRVENAVAGTEDESRPSASLASMRCTSIT